MAPVTEMGWRKDDEYCGEHGNSDSELSDDWGYPMAN